MTSASVAILPSVPPHHEQGKVRGLLDIQVRELRMMVPMGQPLQVWVSWQPKGRARRVAPVPLFTSGCADMQFAIRVSRDVFRTYCSEAEHCVIVLETQTPEPTEVGSCSVDLRALDVAGHESSVHGKELQLWGPKGGEQVGGLRLSMSSYFGADMERAMTARPAATPANATCALSPSSSPGSVTDGEAQGSLHSSRSSTGDGADVAAHPMLAVLAALSDFVGRESPPLARMFEELDTGGMRALSCEQAGELLGSLIPVEAAPWQLEFLTELLDADEDGVVSLDDITGCLEEWRNLVQLNQVAKASGDSGPDPLSIIATHLGTAPLTPEAVALLRGAAAQRRLSLAEAVALLRALLPGLSPSDDRQVMASLARLDRTGSATVSARSLLTAIGLDAQSLATGGGPTPTFERAARNEYAHFMRAAMAEQSDNESPMPPTDGALAALAAQAGDLISPGSGSLSSSVRTGTPYGADDAVGGGAYGSPAQNGGYRAVSNPLYPPSDPPADGTGSVHSSASSAFSLDEIYNDPLVSPSRASFTGGDRSPWTPTSSSRPPMRPTRDDQGLSIAQPPLIQQPPSSHHLRDTIITAPSGVAALTSFEKESPKKRKSSM